MSSYFHQKVPSNFMAANPNKPRGQSPYNPQNYDPRQFGRQNLDWGSAWKTSNSKYGHVTPHQTEYSFSTLHDRELAAEKPRNILRGSVWDAPPRTDSGRPMTPTSVLRYRGITPHENTADFELMRLPDGVKRQTPVSTSKAKPMPPDKVFMDRYQRPVKYDEITKSLTSHQPDTQRLQPTTYSYQDMGNPGAPLFSRIHPRY